MDENIRRKWVSPFYMNILRGSYTITNPDSEFISKARIALKTISPDIVNSLFAETDWRSRITAAWFCGIKQWRRYEDTMAKSLLASRVCYAGQGYCFALAHFGDETSAHHLVRYLETYLPQIGKYYDQGHAMAALMWIDEKRGTNLSTPFMAPNGLWEAFVAEKIVVSDAWRIDQCKKRFYRVMKSSIELFSSE